MTPTVNESMVMGANQERAGLVQGPTAYKIR